VLRKGLSRDLRREPDLSLCGFSLWIEGRERENSPDYHDSNWLVVAVEMHAPGVSIEFGGSFLMTMDIERFRDELVVMDRTLKGSATLESLEPNLELSLTASSLGHVDIKLQITPDHFNQQHSFVVQADQSYLRPLIRAADNILKIYPVLNLGSR
jgi:hypothetical protein